MTKRDDGEENTRSLIDLGSEIIQAIKDPFLVFLIVLALSVPGALWLLPEYMGPLPVLYPYIAMVVVFAVLGMWARHAVVQRERDRLSAEDGRLRDRLSAESEGLKKDLRDARDELQRCLKWHNERVAATNT